MKQSNVRYSGTIFAVVLCVLWILMTSITGTLGLYEYPRNGSHLSIIITVLIPTLFFTLLFILFPTVRNWTGNINLAILTLPHAWRTVGFTFLTLWFHGILPAGFAAPAGLGDFAIAIAAPFVAIALWLHLKGAIVTAATFHLLGIIDFFFALLTGITGYGALAEQMDMTDPMTAFPLVIIPTAFVPLLLVSHVMALTKITMDKKSGLT